MKKRRKQETSIEKSRKSRRKCVYRAEKRAKEKGKTEKIGNIKKKEKEESNDKQY